ncbi:cytochrome C-551 [soil metagenome]
MIRSIASVSFLATIALAASAAFASDALAAKNSCTACHAKDHKVVGPAFKDLAAKYAGDAGAADKLVAKVKKGGSGVWGSIPMPPNSQVSDADAKALVGWILKMK